MTNMAATINERINRKNCHLSFGLRDDVYIHHHEGGHVAIEDDAGNRVFLTAGLLRALRGA
jgi:hypothetical protein